MDRTPAPNEPLASPPAPPERDGRPSPHAWLAIAVGRVCSYCKTAQAHGEFDDSVPCLARPGRPNGHSERH